jgi:acetyltransferase
MDPAKYSTEPDERVTLLNRKVVRIRPLSGGEDKPIRELWAHLSPRTRYLRFLTPLTGLPDSLVRLLAGGDNRRQLTLVAEYEAAAGAEVVGLANFGANDDCQAELGLVVRDDWQNQRVGTLLAARIMEAAERRGFHQFVVHVLPDNLPIRRVLKKLGVIVSVRIRGGVSELAFVRRSS